MPGTQPEARRYASSGRLIASHVCDSHGTAAAVIAALPSTQQRPVGDPLPDAARHSKRARLSETYIPAVHWEKSVTDTREWRFNRNLAWRFSGPVSGM
jgi:hypothetical protein